MLKIFVMNLIVLYLNQINKTFLDLEEEDIWTKKDFEKINNSWILHIESLFYLIWLFIELYRDNPKYTKVLLDEIHNIIYDEFRKNWMSYENRKKLSNNINKKYSNYNKILLEKWNIKETYIWLLNEIFNLSKIEIKFNNILMTSLSMKFYSFYIFSEWEKFINELNDFRIRQNFYNEIWLKY